MQRIIFPLTVLLCIAVYFLASLQVTHNLFSQTTTPYYNFLISALSKGRLFVTPTSWTYDLSLFKGFWYLYWGPAPILLILPFYLFSRLTTSDVFYTLVWGCVNVALFALLITQAIKTFQLKTSTSSKVFLLVNFALISPNFYLSLNGAIWQTNQILATTYLLIFYYLFLLFLQKGKLWQLGLATVFLCLAWMSRYLMIFNYLLLIIPLMQRLSNPIKFLKTVLLIGGISLFFITITFFYDFGRFGNPLETGYRYQLTTPRYMRYIQAGRFFTLDNFYHNFQTMFLSLPTFNGSKINFDPEGNSILAVYPLTLLLPLLIIAKLRDGLSKAFTLNSLIILSVGVISILLYVASGWIQVGYRYFLDLVPLWFLLTIFVLDKVPKFVKLLITLSGLYISYWSIVFFYLTKIPS